MICSKCKEDKSISQFNKHKGKKFGVRGYCKACQAESEKVYRSKLKDTTVSLPEFKICNSCGLTKSKDDFWKRGRSPDGLRWFCKSCCANTPEYIEKTYRATKRNFVVLAGGCCQRCGYQEFLPGLTFHHINRKEKGGPVSSLTYGNFEVARQEIDKCILLCSNCHLAFERGYWQAEFIKRDGLGYTIK